MRERLGDIRAPVPFWTPRRFGLKPPIFVKERRPETHQPALVERKGKRVLHSGGMHGRQAEQIGLDRKRVMVGHIGIGRERHRGIKTRTVWARPALHGVKKIL
jgi:hypothetical protein